MPNRTSPDLATKMRGAARRLNARMHLSASDRFSLQLAHTPVAVLGGSRPRV